MDNVLWPRETWDIKAWPNTRNIWPKAGNISHLITLLPAWCCNNYSCWTSWPNARATFQHNILLHCCLMLQHVLHGLVKRTQHFHHFQHNIWLSMCPRPLARNKWTWCTCSSPTMLRECHAKQVQHHTTSKCCMPNLTIFEFDPTCCNMSQHGDQTYAKCYDQQCCKMLHWNVASIWPGLNVLATYDKSSWAKHYN